MIQQHPQRDTIPLRHRLRLPILIGPLQDTHGPELRTKPLHRIGIVEGQPSLFDQLHRRDAANHLGARCYPEDCVEGYGLFGVDAPFPAGVREKGVAISVDDDGDAAGDSVGVGSDVVHAGAIAILGSV